MCQGQNVCKSQNDLTMSSTASMKKIEIFLVKPTQTAKTYKKFNFMFLKSKQHTFFIPMYEEFYIFKKPAIILIILPSDTNMVWVIVERKRWAGWAFITRDHTCFILKCSHKLQHL
jgi:hypothetical protein